MNIPISSWAGKRVWIVGASTGIGEATARDLLKQGALVAVSARRQDLLDGLAAEYPNALAIACDVTQPATLDAAVGRLIERWEGLDLVVCAAGAYMEMRADSFNAEAAGRLFDINVKGVMHCVGAVLPTLLAQGCGGIAIVSSVAGYSGLPRALAYGATKAALINFCESLYIDLAPRGINVHLINPGFVATPMTASNGFPMPALTTTEEAATQIISGIARGEFHIHFPTRFTNWLRLARLLPYRLYFFLIRRVTGL